MSSITFVVFRSASNCYMQKKHVLRPLSILTNDDNLTLRIQSPSQMMSKGCIITSLERDFGSITILRR